MVIIEVNRDYAHFDRILGEHRWAEFLQKPTKEESGRVTQVFYCTYSTGRIVQKNGAFGLGDILYCGRWRYKVFASVTSSRYAAPHQQYLSLVLMPSFRLEAH